MSDNDLWGMPEMPEDNTISTSTAAKEWADSLPTIYETQLKYAPQEAALNVSLAQQYALPYAEALKSAQERLYPNETRLSNELTQQTIDNLNGGMPSWARQSYISDYNSNLGSNAGSPIGADYVSRGLLQQGEDWKKYYQNLGLSIAGKQPTYSAQAPSYTNYMSSWTPSTVYGIRQNALSNSFGTQANMYGNYTKALAQIYGAVAGGAGQAAGAGGG